MNDDLPIVKKLGESLEQLRNKSEVEYWQALDDLYDLVAGTYQDRPPWIDMPPRPGSDADIWFNSDESASSGSRS